MDALIQVSCNSQKKVQVSKYPHCRKIIPSRKVARTWYRRFTESGRIDKGNVHRERPPVGPLNVEAISNIYQENQLIPPRSTTGSHIKTSVYNVVRKKIKLYPYKIQIVQYLEDPDYEKPESFTRTDLDLINDVTLP